MIGKIDEHLIERAQDAADALGISPLKIAAQLCMGCIAFSILYEVLRWEGTVNATHFLVGVVVVVLAGHYRLIAAIDDKPAGPAMNPLRLRYWLWRRLTIFLIPTMAGSMTAVWFHSPALQAAIDCALAGMFVCLPFFASCTKRPPKQKRATVMRQNIILQGA
ncbi:hypothetical protein [Roseococcus pinisoli]|uniref:Uncharacterized protein n=1 Tax=Roseococcus pinisoli TaxID=2835040 RepID=A0ABS5QF28_9PROT|nr:hypothetical protein [Roseococcus pinisoli]MBS7812299.1 hypothetical protein [Roseococcus pinisoli]